MPGVIKNNLDFCMRSATGEHPICPGYYSINLSSGGCRYGCAFCWGQDNLAPAKKPHLIDEDFDSFKKELSRRLCDKPQAGHEKYMFVASPYGDMFATGKLHGQASYIVKKFSDPFANKQGHAVLFWTRGTGIGVLEDAANYLGRSNRVIVSVSLNTPRLTNEYEPHATTIDNRFKIIERLRSCGYRIRISISPIIPQPGAFPEYRDLLHRAVAMKPERITLGFLQHREVRSVAMPMKYNLLISRWCSPRELPGYWMVPQATRIETLHALFQSVSGKIGLPTIGVCRETQAVFSEFPFLSKEVCNCTLKIKKPVKEQRGETTR